MMMMMMMMMMTTNICFEDNSVSHRRKVGCYHTVSSIW